MNRMMDRERERERERETKRKKYSIDNFVLKFIYELVRCREARAKVLSLQHLSPPMMINAS